MLHKEANLLVFRRIFLAELSSQHYNGLRNPPADKKVASSLEPTTSALAAPTVDQMGPHHQQQLSQQKQQEIKSRRREFKAVYLTAAFVLPLPVCWFPFIAARVYVAAGSTREDVPNLLEISGGISIFYSSVNWLTYAAVSKSFRRAYREMWAKVRAKYHSTE